MDIEIQSSIYTKYVVDEEDCKNKEDLVAHPVLVYDWLYHIHFVIPLGHSVLEGVFMNFNGIQAILDLCYHYNQPCG